MLANKRTQIRNNIRKAELLNHFALKRRELIQDTQKLAQQLFLEIEQQKDFQTNIHLIGKLLAYHKQNPLQENTYVLISNYLINQTHDIRYFFHTIVSEPKYLEHYMWCLSIIALGLHESLQMNGGQVFAVRQQVGELMESAMEVVLELLANLKSDNQKSNKQINMFRYYIQIVKLVLERETLDEFPSRIVELFVDGVSYFNLNQTQHQVIMHIWKCMIMIIENHNKRLQSGLRQKMMRYCRCISELVLEQMTMAREQCIQFLRTIISEFPVDFMNLIYSDFLMKQILFILKEIPSLKSISIKLIRLIIQQCNLPQLAALLQLGIHTILTQSMEWSMISYNNICLQDCLSTLYNILSVLNSAGEERLLRRVKQQMQEVNFDKMIEGLSQNNQTEKIWGYLSCIIDDFYSEEIY